MPRYMLLLRGGDADAEASYTPEQVQEIVQRYIAWSDQLRREGRHRGADELKSSGPVVRARNGQVVVDGPYAETKENIGGYYIIEAADEAEAIEVAKGSPALRNGGAVEIREIIEHP